MEKRGVAQMFIERIAVTQTAKYRVADVEIHWHNETVDEFVLLWSAKMWMLWLPAEVEILRGLLESKATQEEMQKHCPIETGAIRIKIYEIIGKSSFYISPKPIRDEETYADYLERMEQTGWQHPRTRSSRWRQEEVETIDNLLNQGATQLSCVPH